jgi:pyruvate,water dikinase
MGLTLTPRMAVVIQRLVAADVSGVLFTSDPRTGADVRLVEAAFGLGETIVQGEVVPDCYMVARGGRVLDARRGELDVAVRPAPGGGTQSIEVAPSDDRRVLDDAQLTALDLLAARCEALFGGALDLEWAFADGRLWLLQCRPVTGGTAWRK